MKRLISMLAAMTLLALATFVAVTKAEPPSGVSPTLLASATFDAFKVKSDKQGPIEFEAEAKGAIDMLVRQHDYNPRSTTGWHSHAGPVFIFVTRGTLTYYEYDDPTCTPHVVTAGQAFVDDGAGHVVRNETDLPAQDISVITAPVGGPLRRNLPAPNPNCGF